MPADSSPNPSQEPQASCLLQDTTIIVVSYFSSHCFDALRLAFGSAPHVIVVDNSQSAEEAACIAQTLPQAKLVRADSNLGFGAANNLGLRMATTQYVALVNPDCPARWEDIAQLSTLLNNFPDASAAAPQLIDRHGRPDISYRASRTRWNSKGPAASGPVCVEYASAAMLLIRRDAMMQIGGFDEEFFLYYEDDDLCLRLTDAVGPIIVDPAIRVPHLSRQSSRHGFNTRPEYNRGFHHIQSKFMFQAKHQARETSTLQRWRYAAVAGLECLIRAALLDLSRAARAFGRMRGALAYSSSSALKAKP